MADQRQSDVLGALPRSRPHRRSAKRPPRTNGAREGAQGPELSPAKRAKAPAAKSGEPRPSGRAKTGAGGRAKTAGGGRAKARPDRLRQPPQPRGIPSQPRSPVPPAGPAPHGPAPQVLSTVVQATAEVAEIGLALSARALRRVVGRLPRP